MAALLCLAALGVAGQAASQPVPPPSAAASASPAAPAQTALDKADELYRKGMVAGAVKDWPRAFEHLLGAYQLKKSYDIEGNLGAAELKLGKYRDAAEHLQHSLTLFPVNGKDENKRRTEELLAEAKKEVGILKLTISPAAALVNVGGRALPPGEPHDQVFVEPGEMRIEVGGVDQYEPANRSVKVAKGQVVELAIALKPVGKTVPAASASTSASATSTSTSGPAPTGPRKALVITGVVLTGAGLIAGVATGIAALTAGGDAQSQLEKIRSTQGPCKDPADTPACKDLAATRSQQSGLTSAAFWSLAGAGIAGAATLIYVFVAQPKGPPATVGIAPTVSTVGGGLTIVGRW